MKCISVRQPWASAIIELGKDVENRSWACEYRGPLLIHASTKRPTHVEVKSFLDFADKIGCVIGCDLQDTTRWLAGLAFGGIIGRVNLVNVTARGHLHSAWAEKDCMHWVLEDPEPLPFVQMRGRVGLYDEKYPVHRKASNQMRLV